MKNKITQDYVKNLFYFKDGNLFWKKPTGHRIKIGDQAGSVNKTGYLYVGINNTSYRVHRLVYLYHHGYLPKFVDHINGNRVDNRIENLRDCSSSENNQNRIKKIATSKWYGVCWAKKENRWKAQIQVNHTNKHIGYFATEDEAARAYNRAAKNSFGEFARINAVD